MDTAKRDALIGTPHTAVLATQWTRGRVHTAPVWYLYEDGVFKIITERGSQKHRNAVRAGRATICVDERDGRFAYVMAEGPVRVVDPVSFEQRLALHRHYRGEEGAHRAVDGGGHEKMVMLVVTPERWIGWGL
ncbi:MAG TPA: pyridoxamine 5'-phosphate oxidase family protein [Dehalococcoidia bacterium]|nr:pyridoxamine 5'-phosphate oxidase family protein [Dehalococcoidia bacterium]